MKKKADMSLAPGPSTAGRVESLGDGWKIKEWKAPGSPPSARPMMGTTGAEPGCVPGKAAFHKRSPQRRQWRRPLGILGGMSVALVALIMMANVMQPEAGSSDVAQPANAATLSSSMSAKAQKAEVRKVEVQKVGVQKAEPQQTVSRDEYQLYLGAYPSEVGARLLWAGLKASPGATLDGLDPAFERSDNELGTLYHVIAGTLSNHDDADRYCEQIKQQNVVCTVFISGG